MQMIHRFSQSPAAKAACFMIAAVAVAILFRRAVFQAFVLIAGGCVISFIALPLSKLYERRFPRPVSVLLSLLSIGIFILGILWIFLPIIIREFNSLRELLPRTLENISVLWDRLQRWIEIRLPGVSFPSSGIPGLERAFTGIASGAVAFAGNIAEMIAKLSLMIVLSYFFMKDREKLLLRTELMIPRIYRPIAVRMGNAVLREMRLYLRGQAMIALAVGSLSCVGLLIIGVSSAVILGPVIGTLNMIPYFGPFIGGVPAVIIAFADGWQKAILCIGVLFIVQQLDSMLISPRIMGSVTGLSPAIVLVAIFTGAQIGGILGMLLALPVVMIIRTLFRVFVQKYENI